MTRTQQRSTPTEEKPAPLGECGAGVGTAHAKAILLGEHAVVHGTPALVVPLHPLRVHARVTTGASTLTFDSEVYRGPADDAPALFTSPITAVLESARLVGLDPRTLAVTITGYIPPERGLGSSAAVAAALSQAVARLAGVELTARAHFELIQAAERVAHGTPSGLDARGVVADGPVRFEHGEVTPVTVGGNPRLIVADTGVRGGTRGAVADVASRREADPVRVEPLLERIGVEVRAGVEDLEAARPVALGERLSRVHRLLDALGVSSPELDRLVEAAEAAGAYGAKLTGGGRGGCVLALVDESSSAAVDAALRQAGAVQTWVLDSRGFTA